MGYFIARTPMGFCFRKKVDGKSYAETKSYFESKGYTAGPWIPGEPNYTIRINKFELV
jgi:hypothetical protein